ncbi:MAG: TerB family tellurite resistance protein [Rhodospirillales bacterium]
MSVWGKVIGSVTGFALGGPLGAILGMIAGHAVDRTQSLGQGPANDRVFPWGQSGYAADREQRQVAFSVAVIVLGAKLAKVDGTVTRAEVNAFKETFHIPPEAIADVGRIFNEARGEATGFEPYAYQIAEMFAHEPRVLEELLGGLFHIAKADSAVSPAEKTFIRSVAHIFGFDGRTFNRILASHVGGADEADPYAVLGLARGAGDGDIKKTYRRLIRENHPDVLIAQGMPTEFVAVANEKMAAINAAYDRIEKERGLR